MAKTFLQIVGGSRFALKRIHHRFLAYSRSLLRAFRSLGLTPARFDMMYALETAAYGLFLGPSLSGLLSRYNLFAPGTLFSAINASGARQTLNLSGWQSVTGQDGPSRVVDPQLNPDTLAPGPTAVDWGEYVGIAYCGSGPDIGAVETGCP